jgi:hypothetical protein
MLLLILLAFWLVATFLILLPLLLWRHEIYRRFSGSRLVSCPENQRPGVVSIDTRHAMSTGIDGRPDLRLCDCSRWPERANCDQACLAQATREEPTQPGELKIKTKQIYHLPVVLAAFAAWYLGAIWHSQFLFRTRWLNAIGAGPAELRQIVGLYLLLSLAVCLLFAYGVAWLLAVCHRKGILNGVLMSTLLCGAVIVMGMYGMPRLPHDFLAIETGYTVLTTLTVGAIVGGLYDKLVMRPQNSALRT